MVYGVGDASGRGHWTSWDTKDGVEVSIGVWNELSQQDASNYKELRNLLNSVDSQT